jgi:adenine-specific DNA-methyltransferase
MARTKVFKAVSRIKRGNLPSPLLWHGDTETFLDALPEREVFDLVITSPPYNIGKPYEQPIELDAYLAWQERLLEKTLLRLKKSGSICWQVGNFVQKGSTGKESEILPLDILFFERFRRHRLKLRNRVIWHFGHGLHCKHRFSGRYEVVLWFSKSDDYYFDLDAVRVKPKYPGKKHFKGPRAGEYSCNPKGKNPEDVWVMDEDALTAWDLPVWDVPNVKSNHVEKTFHPCQFPVALVDRFVLSLTPSGGLVFDPFAGVASAGVASLLHGRRFWGCEIEGEYVKEGVKRLDSALSGNTIYRPFEKPIFDHTSSPLSKEPERHASG